MECLEIAVCVVVVLDYFWRPLVCPERWFVAVLVGMCLDLAFEGVGSYLGSYDYLEYFLLA